MQDIWDSFQVVLDSLDAARADLYAFDEQQGWAESPLPTWRERGEPARTAGLAEPIPSLFSPPAPPRPTQPARDKLESRDPGRPQAVVPSAVEPEWTGGVHQVDAPQDVVVEPLWLRNRKLEAVPPPLAGKRPTASGPDEAYASPPVTFLPPAPLQEDAPRRTGPRSDTTGSAIPQHPAAPSEELLAPPLGASPPRARAHAKNKRRGWQRFASRRDTRVAGVFGLGAVSGLILASSLLVSDNPAPAVPPTPSGQLDPPLPDVPAPPSGQLGGNPAAALPEIPGTGVLRQGDSGHGVHELQVRLLQIPNVYEGGAIDGRYDADVRAAVARFQKWYGVRGDETGIYGDQTRHALMLRTK
ncbi:MULTISPECIES: peptidoglycan-binding domain-containing protein [unclassified Streptomyces]|uniref:peptidoglycan-binding domain-containing protein n=1 Tax=unclassified Streptomyces TaxID=2593676 RepID=UPI001EFC188E|nr:peptidoglycan-binding domain-containing protein [Streptomyces sp. SceaMP-e96]